MRLFNFSLALAKYLKKNAGLHHLNHQFFKDLYLFTCANEPDFKIDNKVLKHAKELWELSTECACCGTSLYMTDEVPDSYQAINHSSIDEDSTYDYLNYCEWCCPLETEDELKEFGYLRGVVKWFDKNYKKGVIQKYGVNDYQEYYFDVSTLDDPDLNEYVSNRKVLFRVNKDIKHINTAKLVKVSAGVDKKTAVRSPYAFNIKNINETSI